MKVVVVIPAYNEGKTIAKVVNDLKFYVQEVVVVDDGSSDQTYNEAKKAGAVVVRHIINLGGPGGATQTGISFALRHGADVIFTFDADGQHFVEDVPALVKPILENKTDVVIGSRLISKKGMPWFRVLANFTANIFTYLLFGIWTTDSQSGLKAFSREAAQKIKITMSGFEFSSEIIAEIKRNNLRLVEVPIRIRYTDYSLSKGQNFLMGLKTLWRLILHRLFD